jgi:hypothetical protein
MALVAVQALCQAVLITLSLMILTELLQEHKITSSRLLLLLLLPFATVFLLQDLTAHVRVDLVIFTLLLIQVLVNNITHHWSITGAGTIVGSTTGSSISVLAGNFCGSQFSICDTITCDEGQVVCCRVYQCG